MMLVELIALLLAILILVKIIVLLVKPTKWFDAVGPLVLGNKAVSIFIVLIFSAILFYYLSLELNIAQLFVAIMLGVFLAALSFLPYMDEFRKVVNRMYSDEDILKKYWYQLLIWLFIVLWVLFHVLG